MNDEKTLPELFEEMKEIIAASEGDFEKFVDKGNKSAGTRVRTAMQSVRNIAQSIRKEVQKAKNS